MQRALQLAQIAEGCTLPNPMVGAVIAVDGKIIGEGWHHKAGEPHAEVMAFAAVPEELRHLIPQATMYVTLEPCSHYGKTPPCAERIIQEKVKRVVVAMQDPFPQVAGRGLKMLREAGIEVQVGLLEEEARALNKIFLTNVTKRRPFVTLKWAQSMDGFIDRLRMMPCELPTIFSAPVRTREVHHLRHLHDAILVGRKTIIWDNPTLNNRFFSGRQPIRIVLDSTLSLLDTETPACSCASGKPAYQYFNLFKENRSPVWLVADPERSVPSIPLEIRSNSDLPEIALLAVPHNEAFIPSLLKTLYEHGICSLLVEGGTQTLQSFIDSGIYDEVQQEIAPICLADEGGTHAPTL